MNPSQLKHTPGGWNRNIPPAKKYNTIFAGRNTHVAHLHTTGLTDDEVEANANLIAAAPDLLEAAIKALQLLQDPVKPGWGVAKDILNIAINKAVRK